ncbi:glycosyltransferase [Synechocystis salina LEGE 06099]|uniref:glycosyltransferase n=1 Tax=Synechocystis salina TaxID=945780 RepID=UPI001881C880|nr:glycosyltransferase [Synechocystis salina]MBE9204805.1 glycosyltransferase [Synechocystis salina LEGE 06099]
MIIIHQNTVWLSQTQTWLYHQIKHLPCNIENHIVCDQVDNLEQFYLPNIHNFSENFILKYYFQKAIKKLFSPQYYPFLVDQAKIHNAQILHSHFGNRGWQNLVSAKQAKLKHIVTFYGFDVNYLPKQYPFWLQRYQALFQEVDYILCEGSHMAKCIVEMGCPAKKVKVHHLGVSVDNIPFKPRQWDPSQPLRILIASSFVEKKGIPYSLEAVAIFQKKNSIPIQITIIGDARQEKRQQQQKKKIIETIEKYDLQSKVKLMGYQPYLIFLKEAYQHHIFLSPSITSSDGDTEGGAPISILEMAASGMPILSTIHCDIPDIIQEGKTGLLAKERDAEGLAENLQWLVDHPKQWQIMLRASRNHIEQEYNVKIQSQRLVDIYQCLIKGA